MDRQTEGGNGFVNLITGNVQRWERHAVLFYTLFTCQAQGRGWHDSMDRQTMCKGRRGTLYYSIYTSFACLMDLEDCCKA